MSLQQTSLCKEGHQLRIQLFPIFHNFLWKKNAPEAFQLYSKTVQQNCNRIAELEMVFSGVSLDFETCFHLQLLYAEKSSAFKLHELGGQDILNGGRLKKSFCIVLSFVA